MNHVLPYRGSSVDRPSRLNISLKFIELIGDNPPSQATIGRSAKQNLNQSAELIKIKQVSNHD